MVLPNKALLIDTRDRSHDEFDQLQDMKKVWQSSWLFAGFTFQIQNTGDYFTYQVGDDSIIVIRSTFEIAKELMIQSKTY